ncbi:MAG: ammonium transporter [Thermoplasmata archaeon]|nr:ammonium transporter [Thermoplasmata archaeon]
MIAEFLVNNLWVLVCGLLVFTMTIAVGFLEVGELGEALNVSLLKTVLMTCLGVVVMAIVGFNTAFAPTWNGIIGNPSYGPGLFLGGFGTSSVDPTQDIWWSMTSTGFNTGLTTGTYFLFETAFAAVTLALVGVVVLRKVKPAVFALYSVVYFAIIWNLPAAWIWNPSGWLAKMGMVDFAGGLVVHGAAGAAGLGILVQIWREEKAKGLRESPQIPYRLSAGWFTLGILLLWVGWFGFNPGSVLAFNDSAMTVVLTTFLAAATGFVSLMLVLYWVTGQDPGLLGAGNGILMGLIVITPVAGFVSPGSAIILGLLCGPLFYVGEMLLGKAKWIADPIGLLPGHLLGGLFGLSMIAFFAQGSFAAGAGAPSLPNGLLFGGGMAAVHQLGIEALGAAAVLVTVFALSFVTVWILSKFFGGITTDYRNERLIP